MKPTLRNIERKVYAQPKHTRGKKADQKVGQAIIVESGKSNSRNSRNLIIGQDVFKPQGKPGAGNVYYECKMKGCHARATISQHDWEHSHSCKVTLKNEHSHAPERKCVMLRGGFYSDSEEEDEAGSVYDEQSATSFQEESAWTSDSILEFVDANEQESEKAPISDDQSMQEFEFADLNNNLEWNSQEAEQETPKTNPLEVCSQSSSKSALTEPLQPEENPTFLTRMLNLRCLKQIEIERFKLWSDDWIIDHSQRIYKTLKLIPSKFGKGVASTIDINQGEYIGSYYGTLCRSLPKDALYSFQLNTNLTERRNGRQRPLRLFINAEQERPLLA